MRGGKRPGAGRPKGAATKRTREIADKAAAEGITPLDVMLSNMRFWNEEAAKVLRTLLDPLEPIEDVDVLERFRSLADMREKAEECAKDAAPFVHPRLQAVTLGGDKDAPPIKYEFTTVYEEKPK
jgi:hypothetical protein